MCSIGIHVQDEGAVIVCDIRIQKYITIMHLCFYVLIWLALTEMKANSSDSCSLFENVVWKNVPISKQVVRQLEMTSLYECAAECVMSSACESFSFDPGTSTCNLYSNITDDSKNETNRRLLYSESHLWPKVSNGDIATEKRAIMKKLYFNIFTIAILDNTCPY